jgi:hypothetical protein
VHRALLRDYKIVLDSIPKVGYMIADDKLIAEGRMNRHRNRQRRIAHLAKQEAQAVDLSKLSETERIRCIAEVTHQHLVEEACKESSVKKIASHLNGSNQPLALNNALDALKRNLEKPAKAG